MVKEIPSYFGGTGINGEVLGQQNVYSIPLVNSVLTSNSLTITINKTPSSASSTYLLSYENLELGPTTDNNSINRNEIIQLSVNDTLFGSGIDSSTPLIINTSNTSSLSKIYLLSYDNNELGPNTDNNSINRNKILQLSVNDTLFSSGIDSSTPLIINTSNTASLSNIYWTAYNNPELGSNTDKTGQYRNTIFEINDQRQYRYLIQDSTGSNYPTGSGTRYSGSFFCNSNILNIRFVSDYLTGSNLILPSGSNDFTSSQDILVTNITGTVNNNTINTISSGSNLIKRNDGITDKTIYTGDGYISDTAIFTEGTISTRINTISSGSNIIKRNDGITDKTIYTGDNYISDATIFTRGNVERTIVESSQVIFNSLSDPSKNYSYKGSGSNIINRNDGITDKTIYTGDGYLSSTTIFTRGNVERTTVESSQVIFNSLSDPSKNYSYKGSGSNIIKRNDGIADKTIYVGDGYLSSATINTIGNIDKTILNGSNVVINVDTNNFIPSINKTFTYEVDYNALFNQEIDSVLTIVSIYSLPSGFSVSSDAKRITGYVNFSDTKTIKLELSDSSTYNIVLKPIFFKKKYTY